MTIRMLAAVLVLATASTSGAHAAPPKPLIDQAMETMGGETLLRNLPSLSLHIQEVAYRIDDSERWQSPAWIWVRDVQEVRDLKGGRTHRRYHEYSPQFDVNAEQIDDGALKVSIQDFRSKHFTTPSQSDAARLAFSPERVLLTAKAATDLRATGQAKIDGVAYDTLAFTWQGFPAKLYLDRQMHLPRRLEMTRTNPYDLAQSAWGDVHWITDWLFWKRETDGFYYPRQWNQVRNGEPYVTDSVVSLDRATPVDAAQFNIADDVKASFAKSGSKRYADLGDINPKTAFKAVGDRVWLLSGAWNVLVAEQTDGLVVIECPQSGGYSAKVLAAIAVRFPGARVKAVVSTTDSLWHFAGLRAYVARDIPVYALAATAPQLRKFIAAPHTLDPDALAKTPRPMRLHEVSGPTTIGEGRDRMVLYPIGGHGDERMVMVYFPALRLLYGSSNDLNLDPAVVGPRPRGTFNLPEVVFAAKREGLVVDDYLAIHTDKLPWSTVVHTAFEEPTI